MKIFEIQFDENDPNAGIYGISLVEDPANGYATISLSNTKSVLLYCG